MVDGPWRFGVGIGPAGGRGLFWHFLAVLLGQHGGRGGCQVGGSHRHVPRAVGGFVTVPDDLAHRGRGVTGLVGLENALSAKPGSGTKPAGSLRFGHRTGDGHSCVYARASALKTWVPWVFHGVVAWPWSRMTFSEEIMNKSVPYWIMLFSVVMGLAAVLLAGRWLQRQGTLPVVIAAQDLPMGVRLEAAMLDTQAWPVSNPLKNTLHDKSLAENRVLNRPLLKGELILEGKLAPAGEKGGLSATLREGRRAVTVKVNEIVGVAGFALPGNFVDVMVNTQEGPQGPISKILLERLQVPAVAQDLGSDENKPRVVKAVTLEVTPAQAEHLDLARNIGSLSLVLRSQLDAQNVPTSGARTEDLLSGRPLRSGQTPALAKPVAPSGPISAQSNPKLEVIRGLHRSLESSRLAAH